MSDDGARVKQWRPFDAFKKRIMEIELNRPRGQGGDPGDGHGSGDGGSERQRETCALNELWISTKCGESDTTSGCGANPTVGNAFDKLYDAVQQRFPELDLAELWPSMRLL